MGEEEPEMMAVFYGTKSHRKAETPCSTRKTTSTVSQILIGTAFCTAFWNDDVTGANLWRYGRTLGNGNVRCASVAGTGTGA